MPLPLLLMLLVQNPPVVVVGEKPAKERKICRRIESTGSRLGATRDCRTAAQWQAAQKELSERDLNEMLNAKGYGSGPDQKAMRPN